LAQNVVSAVSPLMHLQPSSQQRELIALARRLAREASIWIGPETFATDLQAEDEPATPHSEAAAPAG
jgi:hypothetical protein